MIIKKAVELATAKLATISDSAKLDAQLLLCHACCFKPTKIIAHPEQILTAQQEEYFSFILQQRINGKPLAYIIGKKEFWSLDFSVNHHVLIPRPETELLVELALKTIANIEKPRVLDLGTGSGAIAVSIAKECSLKKSNNIEIVATDISYQALEIAKINSDKHKTSINFIYSDWYGNLGNDKFNVIVCNPPYIAEDDPHVDHQVVKQEPTRALISPDNGLHDLKSVIAGAHQHLAFAGYLIVEHGFQQANQVQQLFNQNKFNLIQTHKDLSGLNRATIGHA